MKKGLKLLICGILFLGLIGCNKEKEVSLNELNDINDKIIAYFQQKSVDKYKNFSYNYVDENNKVVIVGLVDNSKEQQEWFKKNVVNSKYIKFEQGEYPNDNAKYNSYKTTSTLKSNKVDVNILIKYNGILYGKSNSIIDYAGGTEAIGKIDKLIPSIYVPKLNGETNTESILNALVFESSADKIVLYYDNKYVLFEKV